jgi:hypothetical protein
MPLRFVMRAAALWLAAEALSLPWSMSTGGDIGGGPASSLDEKTPYLSTSDHALHSPGADAMTGASSRKYTVDLPYWAISIDALRHSL